MSLIHDHACPQKSTPTCIPSIPFLFCFRFNKNPSKGLKFLQAEGLLGDSVNEVAQFLHTDDKLDKVSNCIHKCWLFHFYSVVLFYDGFSFL